MHLRIEARRGSIRDARHWTRARSTELGLPPSVVSVVELLTSELVANAVVHGSGEPIFVRVTNNRARVTILVTDTSADLPVVRTTGPEIPGGQGMRLVERLAERWGVDVDPAGGKTVWFTVPTQP